MHPVPSPQQGKLSVIAAADLPFLHAVCSLMGFTVRMSGWSCSCMERWLEATVPAELGRTRTSLVLGWGDGMGRNSLSWHCQPEGL